MRIKEEENVSNSKQALLVRYKGKLLRRRIERTRRRRKYIVNSKGK